METLDRVSEGLRSFVLAVESGEYFRRNAKHFDPEQRVDRNLLRNLRATRERLAKMKETDVPPHVLDSLLCRLVFTCYLFDRGAIDRDYLVSHGIAQAEHLRDVLGLTPRSMAKTVLYKLFSQLAEDFNGDLFSDDLAAESEQITDVHLNVVNSFFQATDIVSGQHSFSFWLYDFGIIPIETISQIYEHFLTAADAEGKKKSGAFYTPRFLAEIVLDMALAGEASLLDKRFLDPSCGSGIFLVGLFNRLAESWTRANPDATYVRRANGLLKILRENLFGIDKNRTACRITAFSLYLAFLDHLSPPEIRKLQSAGKMLPRLVHAPHESRAEDRGGTIRCADFFTSEAALPRLVDVVVGNPPWISVTDLQSPPAVWCNDPSRQLPFPDNQLATAFTWKAAEHVSPDGSICFVLPHGTLFHHRDRAIDFQRALFTRHAVERVLNLADYRFFLFAESSVAAIVIRYRKQPPANVRQRIDYLAPKTSWGVKQAEVLTVHTEDRTILTVKEVLDDLKGKDAPQIWKQRFWASPRDWRLLDRLSLYPRLRDQVRQPRDRESSKPWLMAEGFQPFGENDPPEDEKTLSLPGRNFIPAKSKHLDLFLLESDCNRLASDQVQVRRRIKDTSIFRSPHVLVTEGLSGIAFADFDVSFQHAVRGIHGPQKDRNLLIFLTVYLRTKLARYYLFHTSTNWGISRPRVTVEELLRAPFPLPKDHPDPATATRIVDEIAAIVTEAARRTDPLMTDREGIVRNATLKLEPLVNQYFDIHPMEKALIEDTADITIPSIQPRRGTVKVASIMPAGSDVRATYTDWLCRTLNGWSKNGPFQVRGQSVASEQLGVGLAILEKTRRGDGPGTVDIDATGLLDTLSHLQQLVNQRHSTLEIARGLKIFDRNRLYVVKPIGLRYWSRTAALNDADEIAGTLLMHSAKEGA
ncbi:HsdM family class I SAM-dependent methyltransferase [Singulisphaera acidiphila]|uniref:HsdM family class I SAM-dependent methyltransferase n=1 Tax=Singulisphaera acidiphila TaxID=466153 RepID=UPI001ED96E38|nr:N-6 DNA methylase [Singulisphaera acidiphila]